MSDPPNEKVPVRRVPAQPAQPYVNQPIPPKRDAFPYVIGGLLSALVVGIGVIIFLLGSGSPAPNNGGVNPVTGLPTSVPTVPGSAVIVPAPEITGVSGSTDAKTVQPTTSTVGAADKPVGVGTVVPTIPVGQREEDVPRISMDDFKKLYDDPAKRPIIIDVRSKDGYDAGHIKGSISFPEADVATRIKELPKDKLVVAYCA